MKINNVFAIDPSIRACGWCLLEDRAVIAGIVRSKKRDPAKAAIEIKEKLFTELTPSADKIEHLIVEKPIIARGWTKSAPSIEKLLACYGICLSLANKNTRLWTPTVPEWKGQLPKRLTHDRSIKWLRDNHYFYVECDHIPESLIHNARDAAALLVTYLQRIEK